MLPVGVLLVLLTAADGTQERRIRAAPRGEAEIRLDGRLSEPVWRTAEPGRDFVERFPTPGALAPTGHEVRVLFDRDALYVGVRLPLDASSGERPRALELTRDSFSVFDDDAVSLKFDVRLDRRTTVGFVTNAAGTQLDYIALESGKQFRREYDAVWRVATHVGADAWTAEFRLPSAALGIPAGEEDRIVGLNVTRDHATRAATYDWSAVPPELGAFAALYYGSVEGIGELGGGRPLVLIPYVLGRYEDGPQSGDGTATVRGGGDIQLRLLTDLWSELTIFPDFAQVDLDDPVVNFDRFPLFFPERRAFFLAGLQVFDFGEPGVSQLFFSRRIGLDDAGNEIPVWTGLKLYGTQGPLQVGLFQVLTGDETVGTGEDRTRVEGGSWTVARVRHNFGQVAHLGVLGSVQGDTTGGNFDPDLAGGVDGSLRLAQGRLELAGWLAFSEDTETDRGGTSAQAALSYRGQVVQPSIEVLLVDRRFDPAIGFVRRQGILQTDVALDFVRRPRSDQSLQVTVGLNGQTIRASDGDADLGQSAGLGLGLRWRSGWNLDLEGSFVEDVVESSFELLGERTVEPGRYRGPRASLTLASPAVRNPSFSAGYAVDDAFFGGIRHGPNLSGVASLGPHLRLAVDSELAFSRFADGFERETLTVNGRVTVAPSTRLVTDLITQLNPVDDAVTGLFRVRWRYWPGSDLFWVTRYDRDYATGIDRFDTTLKVQFRTDLLL
jgi:hypothetical protein